jgi:hypothetical protein
LYESRFSARRIAGRGKDSSAADALPKSQIAAVSFNTSGAMRAQMSLPLPSEPHGQKEGFMKSILAAGVIALVGAIPALAQAPTPSARIMCMIEMFPTTDAETEVSLQWQQLVACTNTYRQMRSNAAIGAAARQSGASMDPISSKIGTAPMSEHFVGVMCPAGSTDVAGSMEGMGGNCIPGGRN